MNSVDQELSSSAASAVKVRRPLEERARLRRLLSMTTHRYRWLALLVRHRQDKNAPIIPPLDPSPYHVCVSSL